MKANVEDLADCVVTVFRPKNRLFLKRKSHIQEANKKQASKYQHNSYRHILMYINICKRI